ncbi:MAG: phosphomethylpyrimidine synthase ThiC [Spirochaetaceae bacterium]|nr:MAG: phosphomethylpyrimidine synthase ThiC [Spirochaetaceae bacterium]
MFSGDVFMKKGSNLSRLACAKQGIITDEMKNVASSEGIPAGKLCKDIARGITVIAKSRIHPCVPIGIGKGLRIKINANIGTSNFCSNVDLELEKLNASIKYGADTVMDLSTGGNVREVRKRILSESKVPVGTVPVYDAITQNPDVASITEDDFLNAIQTHITDGVDFITVHCGLRKEHIPFLDSRIMGIVSRGGSFLVKWMLHHNRENPLYSRFDEICRMAREHDVVLSLGDSLRPGCIADATDRAQLAELKVLGQLSRRAWKQNVQVIIEGPGHVPLHQIEKNMKLQKKLCHGAPFYVLGPLVTDISPGYDHLTGAIGGALAAWHGADFLCYLTPKEHLGLPGLQDVIDGVIASKIAAHAADIARGIPGASKPDAKMSEARSNLDWPTMYATALNPEKAKSMREETLKNGADVCSMCGDFCSAKINRESRGKYQQTK